MTNPIATRPHPKLTSTFEKGDVVVLTKDSFDYHGMTYEFIPTSDYADEYFQKNCSFLVIECGLSKYFVTKAGVKIKPVDPECSEEWCAVEVIAEDLEEPEYIDGVVRAKDLKLYIPGSVE
ncbi:MAG: hypothetical protein EOO34_00680 [Cyanobacteriota bacterium]|jgi:hypothetical protein|nr:MAG: hypothetical protein EOO34_00680 [Cyanobacteriota bacterium]